jgi:hypothetical protein
MGERKAPKSKGEGEEKIQEIRHGEENLSSNSR